MGRETSNEDHVGELLSGFIDGELTQQDEQRVRLHIEHCNDCRNGLRELRALREELGRSNLSNVRKDVWRESMDDTAVKAIRGIGWLLFIGAILLAAGLVVYELITASPEMSLLEKLLIGGIYGGMLLLFISVFRQRLIERKTDKYKDVEI